MAVVFSVRGPPTSPRFDGGRASGRKGPQGSQATTREDAPVMNPNLRSPRHRRWSATLLALIAFVALAGALPALIADRDTGGLPESALPGARQTAEADRPNGSASDLPPASGASVASPASGARNETADANRAGINQPPTPPDAASGTGPAAPDTRSPVTRIDRDLESGDLTPDDWGLNAARLLADQTNLPDGYRMAESDTRWDATLLMTRLREGWIALTSETQDSIIAMGFSVGEGDVLMSPIRADARYPAIACTYSTDHFDIHYDSTTLGWSGSCGVDVTSTPEYARTTGTYFETAYDVEVNDLSWTAPPSDGGLVSPGCSPSGGNGKYDVFVSQPPELTDAINSGGAWAYTQTTCRAQTGTASLGDNEASGARVETWAYSSMIQLTSNPIPLGVTIASYLDQIASHEFNHALQFGYSIWGGSWAQEATAEWMMTQVNPATANYFFNSHLLGFPDLALTSTSGPGVASLRIYASWIFMQYLSEHWGGHERIREVWEELVTTSDLAKAIDNVLAGQGSTLDAVYRDFAVALRVMSADPGNGIYSLSQSAAWPAGFGFRELGVEGGIPFTGTPAIPYDSRTAPTSNHRLEPRGTDYIAITDTTGLPFKICISQVEATATMAVSLVKQKSGNPVAEVAPLAGTPPCTQVDDAPEWDSFTLVISYVSKGVEANLNYYIEVALAAFSGPSNSWYFAEGYTGPGFQEYLDIQNPGESPANVTIDYQLNGGGTATTGFVLDPKKRRTIDVNDVAFGVGPDKEVSAKVTSTDQPVVAERPMYFNYGGKYNGGHIALGARAPNTTWYFAEGYTAPGFDEYLTLQNPNPTPVTATIEYQRDDGAMAPYLRLLPATSRTTITVHDIAANGGATRGHEVSTKVTATGPIVAERPMYFNYSGIYDGGHDVVGANAPSTTWNFAEGYTGGGFDEYITVQNPNAVSADVTTTYQFGGGGTKTTLLTVPALSRRTITVHAAAEAGRGVDVSAKLTSTQPIVAERPMYFGYTLSATGAAVTGGHDTLGSVGASNAFYFASGETPTSTDEYLTIQNANPTSAKASILYMFADGFVTSKRLTLAANSRTTTAVHNDVGRGKQVAVAVYSDAQVVVERPTYFTKGFGFGSISGGAVVTGANA